MPMKRLGAIAIMICLTVGVAFAGANLVDLHKNAKANAAACAGCHSAIVKQKSTDPKIKAFHPLHLESSLLKFTCVDCHESVDLRDESAAKLRKQVNPDVCKSCHSPWSIKMDASFQKMDCTQCHADWKKKMAKATYVNLAKVTKKDCLGCHGGRSLYGAAEKGKGG